MKYIIPFLVTIFISLQIVAQCTNTAVTTESRCSESGTITITTQHPSIGATHEFLLFSGPIQRPVQSDSVFNNLPAGTYRVRIVDKTVVPFCVDTITCVIAGNYQEPNFLTATVQHIFCPGALGAIQVNPMVGGRLNWQYEIVAGPELRPLQSSPLFAGLPGGIYSVQATDSCGIVRTSPFTISFDTGTINWGAGIFIQRLSCNNLIVGLPQFSWINTTYTDRPIRISWVSPSGDSLTPNANFEYLNSGYYDNDTLIGYQNESGIYKVYVEDTCGRIFSYSSSFYDNSFFVNNSSLGFVELCDGYRPIWPYYNTTDLNFIWNIRRPDGSIYTFALTGPNSTTQSPIFPDLLDYDSTYFLELVRLCPSGNDTFITPNFSRATTPFQTGFSTAPGCMVEGSGSIIINPYSTNKYPLTHIIVDGPSNIGDSVRLFLNGSIHEFRDLPLGRYVVRSYDVCDSTVLDTVDVNIPFVLDKTYEVVPKCDGSIDIKVQIKSNYFGVPVTRVENSIPYYPKHNESVIYRAANETDPLAMNTYYTEFHNLPGNTMFVVLALVTDNDGGGLNGCATYDTIFLTGSTLPDIYDVKGVVCQNGESLIDVKMRFSGVAPLQYRLKPSGSSSWSAYQSNTEFGSLAAGLYDLEVRDACSNNDIFSFELRPFLPLPINAPNCIDPVLVSSVDIHIPEVLKGLTYRWASSRNPLLTLSTDSFVSIPVSAISDSLTILLYQEMADPTCFVLSSIRLATCDFQALPITLSDFYASQNDCQTRLFWNTSYEANVKQFVIESSINGYDFAPEQIVSANNKPSTYSVIAKSIGNVMYYRLKMIEFDGNVNYSKVLSVKNSCNNFVFDAFPSPTKDILNIQAPKGEQVQLINALGKVVLTKEMESDLETIDVSNFPKGVYVLRVLNPTLISTLKVVIE